MIRAGGLTVRRGGRLILSGVDVAARTGRVTGIVGPNGSGKSTLLRTLFGVIRAERGRVMLDGTDVATASRRWVSARIAFVGQHADPDPAMRVCDEVALGAVTGGCRGAGATDARVLDALGAVGLLDHARRRIADLSGGERQRVALARALAQGGSHALIDEPTNHLDVRHRLEAAALLRRIAPTVVVVLHDLELAAHTCDDVVLLQAGSVVAHGEAADVLHPATLDPVYDVRTLALTAPTGERALGFRLPHERTPA